MAETTDYPKTASCSCGALTVTVSAKPTMTHACACVECQRCTGSAFSYTAFFAEDTVKISGATKSFRRSSEAGRWQELNFCPTCGVSVFGRIEALPGIIGVAVGCFADPNFEAPGKLFWASRRHHWLELPAAVEAVETQ
jgi:hypothetical protein